MLAEQRQSEIREIIRREGKAYISELATQYGVSSETIRRDLFTLATSGKIKKVHGGAIAVGQPQREESYALRKNKNSERKKKIGALAATLVCDGDMIGIDQGASAEAFAEALRGFRNLKIFTGSLGVAQILMHKLLDGELEREVILLGGC